MIISSSNVYYEIIKNVYNDSKCIDLLNTTIIKDFDSQHKNIQETCDYLKGENIEYDVCQNSTIYSCLTDIETEEDVKKKMGIFFYVLGIITFIYLIIVFFLFIFFYIKKWLNRNNVEEYQEIN